ncbi:replication initiation protein [Escherichia coli]|uniref:replication initiation protein n=1 Tax=Escherichia coli TaxID=562 RepID=UPI0020CCAEFB|nr:replication initiation protein [Escherichia coli]MCQ0066788.1 replication initiation protein [Escherichia coli]MCQ0134175.1 replication initiation protein [Escherichia coli]MCQ0147116.1 replication initiation protein [Escherichia coli]MCQ0174475.1 replication initiation protein [Escherichia coli]MCQ0261182.1 replication initiation protein [Escherichia coli]
MVQIKLHKDSNVSIIVIPNHLLKNIGWDDGTLLDVVKSDNALHIRRKEDVVDLVTKPCVDILTATVKNIKPGKIIKYNSKLNESLNKLHVSARRVFFICLYLYFNGRYNSDGAILIRADKYAEFIGIDRTMAYKQMKDAADYFSSNIKLISLCDYIKNEGLLRVALSTETINFISAVDGRKYQTTVVLYQSAVKLSGRYSWNLYQLIKSRLLDKSGAFSIKLDELMIELNSRVNLEFKDYKKSVIGRSIDEIVEKTEIKSIKCVNAERQGRRVSKVRFEIEMR